eukprot:336946-Heterocapsa_arctica.AAC.1
MRRNKARTCRPGHHTYRCNYLPSQGGLAEEWEELYGFSGGRGCYPRHHTGRMAYDPQPEVVAPDIGRAA